MVDLAPSYVGGRLGELGEALVPQECCQYVVGLLLETDVEVPSNDGGSCFLQKRALKDDLEVRYQVCDAAA